MAGKPIATIGSMHVCPMCSGTPDVIAQVNLLLKVNGVPVVCVGNLTAHGGSIVDEPTVTISAAVPKQSVTMPLEKIPFPAINIINRVKAVDIVHYIELN